MAFFRVLKRLMQSLDEFSGLGSQQGPALTFWLWGRFKCSSRQ